MPILAVFDFDDTLVPPTHFLFENLAIGLIDAQQIALRLALNKYLNFPAEKQQYTEKGIPQWTIFNDDNSPKDIEWQKKVMQTLMDDVFWDEHLELSNARAKYEIKFNFSNAEQLIKDIIDGKNYVCVATGNPFVGLVLGFLEKALHKDYSDKIYVHSQITTTNEGKQPHIAAIENHFEKKGLKFAKNKILLIDDLETNTELADEYGYKTFVFPKGSAEHIKNSQPYQKITDLIKGMTQEPPVPQEPQEQDINNGNSDVTPPKANKRNWQNIAGKTCVKKIRYNHDLPTKAISSASKETPKTLVDDIYPLSPFGSPVTSPATSPKKKLPLQSDSLQNSIAKKPEHPEGSKPAERFKWFG